MPSQLERRARAKLDATVAAFEMLRAHRYDPDPADFPDPADRELCQREFSRIIQELEGRYHALTVRLRGLRDGPPPGFKY